MLTVPKKNKNNQLDLLKSVKKIRNFPENPNSGGTPAKDINDITKYIDIEGVFPINFNSLSVFIYFISNKKNIKNTLNNKIR
jgi:hypothetical protein